MLDFSQDIELGIKLNQLQTLLTNQDFTDLVKLLCKKDIYHYGASSELGSWEKGCAISLSCWHCQRRVTGEVKLERV